MIAKLPSPGISLACIDEVHCVSEWSHNFRPCYIRIHKVLKELNIPCILGLTATATARTEDQVCRVLNIPKGNCIRQNNSRENLILTVSREHDRLNALLDLLNSQDYKNLDSIIVYVSRQQFADDISNLLNVTLTP